MRKYIYFFVSVICPIVLGQSWSVVSPLPQTEHLHDIQFVNNLIGYAVGEKGSFIRTVDGGSSWVKLTETDSSLSNYSVFFVNRDTGFIGTSGKLFKTTNGGLSFTNTVMNGNVYDIYFVSSQNGWLVTSTGSCMRTTDAGVSWNELGMGVTLPLSSVKFLDRDTGWVVGKDRIFRTGNGGDNWNGQIVMSRLFTDVFFTDASNGCIVGEEGVIWTSTDGGGSWTSRSSGVSTNLLSVFFVDQSHGWVSGESGTILKTTNAGVSWVKENVQSQVIIPQIAMLSPTKGFAVGFDGVILKYSINPKVTVTYPNGPETFYGNSIENITWTSTDVANVKIEYTINNGTNWTTIINSTPAAAGTYAWTVPNIIGSDCRIRISDVLNSQISDQSDNLFNILKAKTLTLKSPVGGEGAKANGKFQIRWESQQVSQVTIEFSASGGATWGPVETVAAATGSYIWSVPGNVTNQGKIRIMDVQNNAIKDQSTQVFSIYQYPETFAGAKSFSFGGNKLSDYRMIGKPGVRSPKKIIYYMSPGNWLEDYSVYGDNGTISSNVIDYLYPYTDDFIPGMAYWILSLKPVTFGSETDLTLPVSDYGIFEIPLNTTWTLITNPFDRTVNWDRVKQENGLAQNTLLHAFNGTWTNSATLVPFTGYYFYNTTGLTHLKVPYDPNGSLQKSGPCEGVIQLNGKVLSIDAVQDARSMSKLQVSIDPNSTVDYDTTDYFAAPSTFEEVSITINSPQLRTAYKRLQAESRPMSDKGLTFDIQFHNVSGNQTNLNFSGLDQFPDKEVFLYDTQIRKFYNLKETRSIIVPAHVKNRKYSLLIGTNSFIDSEKEKNTISEFALMQNYPNPFNPQTVITYSLKEPANVTLSVYDISGSLVGRLVDGYKSEGYHEAVFDAKNLGSGVYIYRLVVRNGDNSVYTETRKMSLLK